MSISSILALVGLASIAAVITTGCAPREPQIERAIERELPRIVGPAESYDVDVQGLRGTHGADRVTAVGRRVEPAGSPVLDRVDVVLVDVTYNPQRGQVERVGQADATVRILDEDIESYLEDDRNLRNVSVTLEPPNRAVVQAQPDIPQLELSPGQAVVTTTGNLVGEGAQINYQVTQVRAAGVTLPAQATRLISQELNPIVDLSGMPIALQVTDVRVEGNAVIAEVTGRYPPP